jgi:hypothetical protein
MNYQILNDLRNSQITLSDSQFIIWVNTPIIFNINPFIDRDLFLEYLYINNYYPLLTNALQSGNQNLINIINFAMSYIENPDITTLNWFDPAMQNCISTLINYGIFTNEQMYQAQKDLIETHMTPAQNAGLYIITQNDLNNLSIWKQQQNYQNQWNSFITSGNILFSQNIQFSSLMDVKNQAAALAGLTGLV